MSNSASPLQRLSPEDIADLEIRVQTTLLPDTREALQRDFPAEQLPDWQAVDTNLAAGWILLHELRSRSTGELLTARLLVDYPASRRGEIPFVLVSFVVTPAGGEPGSKQGKSRGYGSYLRQPSFEITRQQKPHAVGLVAEREAPESISQPGDQRVKRANWMKKIGVLKIEGLSYEIPPFTTAEESQRHYVPVQQRHHRPKAADLLLTRFDQGTSIEGKALYSMVERLYLMGYGLRADDPYFLERMKLVDPAATYCLVED